MEKMANLLLVLLLTFFTLQIGGRIISKTISHNPFPKLDGISGPQQHLAGNKRLAFYGESCVAVTDCAPNLGYECTNNTCLCSRDFIARLSAENSSPKSQTECVLKVGSHCSPAPFANLGNTVGRLHTKRAFSSYIWNKVKKTMSLFEGSPSLDSNCVDNSACVDGVCTCKPDYFKDHRGLCLKRRSLFQPCEADAQCRHFIGLECKGGKCQCRRSMVFDQILRKCYIPAGSGCDAYSSEVDMECVRNSECNNGLCVCKMGYTMSSDGSCGVAHGYGCDNKAKLCSDKQLVCRSGFCKCRNSLTTIYNASLGLCLSKPDAPCSPSLPLPDQTNVMSSEAHANVTASNSTLLLSREHSQGCVSFAKCMPIENSSTSSQTKYNHTCQCVEGYAENSAGECIPSYLSPCEDNDDCSVMEQLVCIDGRCTCPDDSLVFDRTRRKCVGQIGSRCKVIQIERLLSVRVDVPNECVKGAICLESVSLMDGRCVGIV